jgi:hypothetical protein
MADEILIDLEDLFEMLDDDNAPRMQVWATIALCERLDRMNRHLGFWRYHPRFHRLVSGREPVPMKIDPLF